ncbi:MAG: outer membrane lipoprotein chaperone LolA [Candidatus Competibacteraceae bacterium]
MPRLTVFLTGLFLLLGTPALAAPADSQVQGYFRDLKSLQADFTQTILDEQSRTLETSKGQMFMQKPGRFRWDYRQPPSQLIVADGQRMWLYDKELQQVTVRRLDKALSATPLALLSGAAPLENAFVVSGSGVRDGLQWYELRPKEEQPEFKMLRVAFDGNVLKIIELEDAFNQRTRLSFDRLQRNVPIDPELLRFVPPQGVDVVGDVPR